MKKQEFREIAMNLIDADDNYRKTFNDTSIAELSQSVKANGIVQPLVLRAVGERYKIVAGGRRYRAAEKAGLVTVPAVVRDTAEEDVLELQLIENIQREAVPFMEEAYAIVKLRDGKGYDVKEVAKKLGKSEVYVYAMIQLTKMAPDARTIAERGWISKGVAGLISKLVNEDDQTKAANDLARTHKAKLITIGGATTYIEDTFGDSDAAMRKQRVSTFGLGSDKDYAANWKAHLVKFSTDQFERFKNICRGRSEVAVISEAVDIVMRRDAEAATGGG